MIDFFLLNYWQESSFVSTASKITVKYEFSRDPVVFLYGANQRHTVPYKKLKERWRRLYLEFYTQMKHPIEVITFPEIIDQDFVENSETQIWEKALRNLKVWCKESNLGCGLIIRNYDLKGHLIFSKIKIDLNEQFGQSNERMLLFNPSERIILAIYFNEDVETLHKDVYNCIDEVNVLGLLLKDELEGSGVIVTGIVAYSGNNHINCNQDCQNFIVSYNIFTSVKHFNNFWLRYIDQEIYKTIRAVQVKCDKRNVFEAIASKILGFLAHLQFETFDNAVLPTPKLCPEENIIETELLLNRYQMEIVYSKENRIFLTGSYGTGKSIVIYKKIKLLEKSLKEGEIIYYVNFEEKSGLDNSFRLRMKPGEKTKVIKGGFDLSRIIKSNILPKEKENGTRTIHLMVDEYDTQRLSSKEARQLNEIFKIEAQFENSVIFIAIQAMKISRIVHQKINGRETVVEEEGHKIDEVESIREYNLKYIMRITKQVAKLAVITQDVLHGKSNRCTRNLELNHNESSPPRKRKRVFSDKTISHNFQKIIYPDLFYKLVSIASNENNENYQKFVTTYHFDSDSKMGHDICGPLPQLIKVPQSADYFQQMALLAFFLSNIIKTDAKHLAIIYFESKTPHWLGQLLKLETFRRLNVTSDAGEFKNLERDKDKKNRELVLVTDYRCVKGLEFSDVLLVVDVNDHHTKQFLPEAITRCMSNLFILLFPCHKDFHKPETVSDVVKEWEEKCIVDIVELNFCSDIDCRLAGNGSCKLLHKATKFYKDLYNQIRNGLDANLQPDIEKEKEEANFV